MEISFETLEDLQAQDTIAYGSFGNGSTAAFFRVCKQLCCHDNIEIGFQHYDRILRLAATGTSGRTWRKLEMGDMHFSLRLQGWIM